ncbi:TcpE family conjugal transfer membrane protein [Ornithinibacillus contaminans]|uniref:TcpE family conjugal transfer membrane protein n=1 Tax=Ornithinibacillus contaminans TaxID=694055 RepID=UPI00064DC889|nr:TcpE family conjugal transfer membrane protein [Ornithinibacillus contaminans]
MDNEKNRIRSFVLNEFLTFEKKIYHLFGMSLGRPIKVKLLLYFIAILLIEIIIYFTPILGATIRWLPVIYLLFIPAGIAYLLADVRTEGRIPLVFFRSVLLYHFRKIRKTTYIRGREVAKPTTYRFAGYSTVTFAEDRSDDIFKPQKIRLKIKTGISDLYAKDEKEGELL